MRFIPVVKKYSWNVSPEKASLIGTIGGAAVGGLTGGLAGKLVDKKLNKNKTDKGSWLNRNKGALTGAALGAIGGGFGGREIARKQWIKSNIGEFPRFKHEDTPKVEVVYPKSDLDLVEDNLQEHKSNFYDSYVNNRKALQEALDRIKENKSKTSVSNTVSNTTNSLLEKTTSKLNKPNSEKIVTSNTATLDQLMKDLKNL